jgi:hypothetical protein
MPDSGTNSARIALCGMAIEPSYQSIPRYLGVQACLGCAVGACFPFFLAAIGTAEIGALLSGADTPTVFIIVIGSMATFCPLVLATAIGLLRSADQ